MGREAPLFRCWNSPLLPNSPHSAVNRTSPFHRVVSGTCQGFANLSLSTYYVLGSHKPFMGFQSFSPCNKFYKGVSIVISILKMRKLRHRRLNNFFFFLCSTVGRWQGWTLNPGGLTSVTMPPLSDDFCQTVVTQFPSAFWYSKVCAHRTTSRGTQRGSKCTGKS